MYIPENVNTRCGIYMIKNTRNGKKYIGSTKNGPERRVTHFRELRKNRHACDHLQSAWNLEDDKSVFQFSMFIYCKEKDLLKFEQSCFDHMKPEYNASLIAGRPEHTLVVREKMSRAKLGKPSPQKGRKRSQETCAKIGASKKGKPSPKKGKPSGIPAWNKGIPRPESTKEILRIKCSGWTHTEDAIAKISLSGIGRVPWNKGVQTGRATEKTIDNIRAGHRRRSAENKRISGQKLWSARRWNKLQKLLAEFPYWGS